MTVAITPHPAAIAMRNRPGRPPSKLNTDALIALIESGHTQTAACGLLGYVPRTFFHRKTTDPAFSKAIDEACNRYRLAARVMAPVPVVHYRRHPADRRESDLERRRIRYATEKPRPPGRYLRRSEDPADWPTRTLTTLTTNQPKGTT